MHHTLRVETTGRGLYEITQRIALLVPKEASLCHAFIRHTSASLVITENAAPEVQDDLQSFFERLVPDGDSRYRHDDEGPDDMPAHIRSAITQTALTIPLRDGALLLGTWQGVFVWEHRYRSHVREIILSFV